MFGIPKKLAVYREPIITFGANIKDLHPEDDDWNDWIKKFESLISKMYWFKVILHIESENFGYFVCKWLADTNLITKISTNTPITKWTFEIKNPN